MSSTGKQIRKLSHRVTLCRASDVLDINGALSLHRAGIFEAWAHIAPQRSSYFSPGGVVVKEQRDYGSHHIFIRFRTDAAVTSTAWIYEQRLTSMPRWYKVIDVLDYEEEGRFWRLSCRLVEAADTIAKPELTTQPASSSVTMPLPAGVKL